MTITPIASSSKGNAYLVEQNNETLLIDCGISLKCLKSHVDPKKLCGVLITHNHDDHVVGLKALTNKANVPVFANQMTAEAIAEKYHIDNEAFVWFENGQSFDVGPFIVSSFAIPHDATDPVGFLIRGESVYFHATDVGSPLDYIGAYLAEADIATLESNHDPEMLWASRRPPNTKQRIFGSRGHLSNDDACALIKKFVSLRLRHLYLAHLSSECNAPHLALGAMQDALAEIGRTDVKVEVA